MKMEVAKLLPIVAMLIAGFAFSLGAAETFITVNRVRVFTRQEIDRVLNGGRGGYAAPKEVARYLSRFDGDGDTEFDGVKLDTLLSLNSYEKDRDCNTWTIVQRQLVCQKLRPVLLDYCKFCLSALKSACANSLPNIMRLFIDVESLLDFRRKVNEYIKEVHLRPDYPQKLYVIDYLYTLSKPEREEYEHFCKEVDAAMRKETIYLGLSWRYEILERLKEQDKSLYAATLSCVHVVDGKF